MDILLVDGHAATREELVSLIQEEDDLEVVGQAANGEEGVPLAKELHPDIVLMGVVMPGMNGIVATEAVRASDPDVRMLALSNHTGAHLVSAIRAVADGKQHIGEHVKD